MDKRIAYCCVAAILLFLLAGCNQQGATTTDSGSEKEVSFLCPWMYDVSEMSVQNGTMDYYFMSSEGKIVCNSSRESTKWGDCCLIVFPDGQTMLIDCGVTEFGPVLVENLHRMGVDRLDYVVITHPHSDHQNGIFHPKNMTGDGVLDRFEIGQVYHRGGYDPNRDDSLYVEEACTQRNILCDVLKMGDYLQIGQVGVRVLWPKPNTSGRQITGTANVNNSSVVLRFDYGEHASLFSGDLYDDGEFALMSSQDTTVFDVDLLKAPHHGGYTSGSSIFLNIVSAELAVATGYMPIRDDVNRRYTSEKTLLLDDWTYGYIHVSTSGNTMTWNTSRREILSQ